MKTIILIGVVSAMMFSCGGSHVAKSQKRQKTPSHMVMTHDEKLDKNYDARENRKIIENNLANKEKNMKAARKARVKQTEELKNLNDSSSKVKKKKNVEAFTFY